MRFLRKKPAPIVVVRHTGSGFVYEAKDAEALAQFLDSETGRKISVAIDDKVIELALSGHSKDFVLGAKFMAHYLYSLVPKRPEPDLHEQEMAAIQDNHFAHPGAIYRE